ncbi:MAG: hypothetical protein E7027_03045 [Elusimicrobium sp.]|uniref:Uncharacterized protein n=1 Tax=Candidatus Avelusimicrobium gallicola TaxID=2562704 RepID=A0A928DR22_9BACT|nr:hypothetical protein [Elusimicrobium sp.]
MKDFLEDMKGFLFGLGVLAIYVICLAIIDQLPRLIIAIWPIIFIGLIFAPLFLKDEKKDKK